MKNKKVVVFIVGLVVILSVIFFFQKSLITDFYLKPERVELSFDMNNEMLPFILSEKEYIGERYTVGYEYEKNNLDNYISIIFIEKPIDSKEEFFKDKFIDYLKFRIPELDEEMLNIMDYSDTNRVLMEWHRATKLFITSLLFILITIIFLRRIKIINRRVKKELELYYLKEIIYLRINEILEEIIKLVLLIFGGIFSLQWIIKFQFNIPGRYLPVNDIFDFEFYRMLNNNMKMNLSNYGYFYDITLKKVKLLTLGFIILGVITFLLIIKIEYRLLEGGDKCGECSI